MHTTKRSPHRPRLLFLCQNAPWPPHGGQQLRSYNTLRLLAREFEIYGLYFYRARHLGSDAEVSSAEEALSAFGHARLFKIPQEHSRLRLVSDHIRSVGSTTPYTDWTYSSGEFQSALSECFRTWGPNMVHLDSLDLGGWLPHLSKYPVVVSHHNVESSLLNRRGSEMKGLRGAYIRYQARNVRAAERVRCRTAALNLAVSSLDVEQLKQISPRARVTLFPNGVDTEIFTRPKLPKSYDIVFVGGQTWYPNLDGMRFFAREILPLIRRMRGDVSVKWVGRSDPKTAEEFQHMGIDVTGYVEDIRPVVAEAKCYIAPLRIGGGTRLKILDAWSLESAIVATSIACEGLEGEDNVHLLIRDTPTDFARAVGMILDDHALRERLGTNARHLVETTYDWEVLADDLLKQVKAAAES